MKVRAVRRDEVGNGVQKESEYLKGRKSGTMWTRWRSESEKRISRKKKERSPSCASRSTFSWNFPWYEIADAAKACYRPGGKLTGWPGHPSGLTSGWTRRLTLYRWCPEQEKGKFVIALNRGAPPSTGVELKMSGFPKFKKLKKASEIRDKHCRAYQECSNFNSSPWINCNSPISLTRASGK